MLCLVLVMGITAAYAQTDSLLTNPGFDELGFVTLPGTPTNTVAGGWIPWGSETDPNMLPEYYPASDTTNGMATPRIHSGEDAQQYFTFFASHDAGVYQQVAGVAAGDQLQFSVYAYVWSSSGDDVDVSDGSGEIAVQVGIDPYGGRDATSDLIVWSNPLALVDQYAQHSVSATAAGDMVTVFVRSTVNRVAMNNVVYLDDADLIVTGTGPAPTEAVTAEVLPEITEAAATEEIATEAVATEVMVTEVVVVEASPEVTEAAATEAVTVVTEEPTAVPPTATLVPTEPPTAVPPTEIPTEAPPTAIPTDAPPTFTPLPSPTLDTAAFPFLFAYTVQRGDTVGQLATRYGSTVEAIIIANQLGADARIFETQELVIPVRQLPPPTLPPTATLVPSSTPLPTLTPVASETPIVVEPVAQQAPVEAAPPQIIVYVVRYGDTLSSIAARYRVPTRDLARFNNIVNPNLVYVGQVLHIPTAGSIPPPAPPTATSLPPTPIPPQQLYRVQPGDNLYRLSIRFNVPLALLIQVNGIADPTRIFVGQILIIPS
jgi:LysM repeat protein